MGAKSQRKGRAAELALSKVLQGYGYPVKPGEALNFGEEPDLSGLPGIHIECKRCETLRLSEWLEQARRDAARFGGLPAVFHRRNREDWRVTMELEDWIELYRGYQPSGQDADGGTEGVTELERLVKQLEGRIGELEVRTPDKSKMPHDTRPIDMRTAAKIDKLIDELLNAAEA